MPNVCENSLTIDGTKQTITKIVNSHFTKDKDGTYYFDFNTIIKEPKLKRDCPAKYLNKPENIKRIKESAKLYPDEKLDRPWFDWYNWRIDNWGTKWNAYGAGKGFSRDDLNDFIDSNQISIYFDTAWSPCEQIIRQLIDIYHWHGASFEYSYYECGCAFAGGYEYGRWYEIDWNPEDKEFRQWTIEHGYADEDYYYDLDASDYFDDHIDKLTVKDIKTHPDYTYTVSEKEIITHHVEVLFNECDYNLHIFWREPDGIDRCWTDPDASVPDKLKTAIKKYIKEMKKYEEIGK